MPEEEHREGSWNCLCPSGAISGWARCSSCPSAQLSWVCCAHVHLHVPDLSKLPGCWCGLGTQPGACLPREPRAEAGEAEVNPSQETVMFTFSTPTLQYQNCNREKSSPDMYPEPTDHIPHGGGWVDKPRDKLQERDFTDLWKHLSVLRVACFVRLAKILSRGMGRQ